MMLDRPGDVAALATPAVLVVNDYEGQRAAIRSMLEPLGVAIVEADSGRAALRAVFDQMFAVILMDVRMPHMDGYETADLIRVHPRSTRTPIIFVTAHASDDIETVSAYTLGAVDFLFTPLVPDVLRAKVAVFVDLFEQSERLRYSLDSITTLNAALHDSQARSQAVLDNVADGIVTIYEGGLIESFNPAAQALFGYSEQQAIGRPFSLIVASVAETEQDGSSGPGPGLPTRTDPQTRARETLGRRRNGSTFAMEIDYGEIMLGDRRLTLALVRDVSERRAYTDSLEHQALHDELTGLANRGLFGAELFRALASAKRNERTQAVLVMDLDGFKHVNDSHGHDHGDALLKQVAERLVGAMRESDTVARLGGDEFGILLEGETDLAAAVAVAWKIHEICKPGFALHAGFVQVSPSIGIALFPDHGNTTSELLQRADGAMYAAKRSGTGYAVFDTVQETETARRVVLLTDLRQCIGRGELLLHYQPKIDLRTREVSGVEALIRWQHPVRGLLSPASFMPEVERTELIEPVTRWVLDQALRQQQLWRTEGIDLTMAVNISANSLRPGTNLPGIVAELTETWRTTPGSLTLELTEGALIEAHAPEILTRLHETNQTLSIDDFGTGYSSLAYLQRLPVDELKIDRSFIVQLSADNNAEVIVRSIIDLAHNLGLTVVAEGVEDRAAMDLLVAYGCDGVQGYLLGRPCPIDDLTTWLTESPYGIADRDADVPERGTRTALGG
jgi:diguanylate cyclase (GGDEF)-like protein/PAS domain S-box-containing protein